MSQENDEVTHNASPVVLISGGSRGIGAETARLAAKNGYDVCFSFHRAVSAAESVCEDIRSLGQRAVAIQADFGVEADIVRFWTEALNHFHSVQVAIHNVGILEPQMPLVDFTVDRLERVFRVNLIGGMLSAREAVRHMSTERGGRGGVIINVSSVAARLGAPHEYIDYAASKAALDAMTVGLAKEVASEGIRVNGVRPGSTYTEIHATGGEPNRVDRVAAKIPLGRGAQPSEIAAAIVWLMSEQASYVTGSILDVAGGL